MSPTTGTRWQLKTPLDSLLVADQAKLMGSVSRMFDGDPVLVDTELGKALIELGVERDKAGLQPVYGAMAQAGSGRENAAGLTAEQIFLDPRSGENRRASSASSPGAAERHNGPGTVTAFIGWEWSSQPNGGNLPHVMSTPQGAEAARQFLPVSSLESERREKLWDWLADNSARGIPMGGDLACGAGEAPRFLVAAMNDPDGSNLGRLQIVKGWLLPDGTTQEHVFDIALSGDRTDCAIPVGGTVIRATGTYTGDNGAAALRVVGTDPDFDPAERAFYYVRAQEIPTPRYALHDAIALGIDPAETDHPATIQERVFSSPIGYQP